MNVTVTQMELGFALDDMARVAWETVEGADPLQTGTWQDEEPSVKNRWRHAVEKSVRLLSSRLDDRAHVECVDDALKAHGQEVAESARQIKIEELQGQLGAVRKERDEAQRELRTLYKDFIDFQKEMGVLKRWDAGERKLS